MALFWLAVFAPLVVEAVGVFARPQTVVADMAFLLVVEVGIYPSEDVRRIAVVGELVVLESTAVVVVVSWVANFAIG